MKKALMALVAVAFVTLTLSCGGGASTAATTQPESPKAPKIEFNVIKQSQTPTPEWVLSEEPWSEGTEGGKKYLYLRVSADDPDKNTAKLLANGEKIKQMADAIKLVATHEFAQVSEGMAGGGGMDTYIMDAVAAVAKNVDVSGALEAGSYWEYIQEIKGSQDKVYYSYYLRFKIDYNKFMDAMNGAWKDQTKKMNPELKSKGEAMLEKLQASTD